MMEMVESEDRLYSGGIIALRNFTMAWFGAWDLLAIRCAYGEAHVGLYDHLVEDRLGSFVLA